MDLKRPLAAAQLGEVSTNLHLLVFGGLTLSAGLLNLRLPETQDLPLPETLEDMVKRLTHKVAPTSTRQQEYSKYVNVLFLFLS